MWTRNTFIGIGIGLVVAFVALLAVVGIYAIATTALGGSSTPTVVDAEREEPESKTKEEKTKEEKKAKRAPERTSRESADADISLSGPGDATTPPTYLEKGTLIIDMEHSPSDDAPDEWGYRNFVVRVNDSEGKIVAGSHVWQQGDYRGSRSVAIPEDGNYTIQVQGQSPWTVDATHYPAS